MGKSFTYNVIGLGQPDAEGSQRMFPAMNRVAMAQEIEKARRFENIEIIDWYSQTKTGEKMIESGPSTRLKICSVCQGRARAGNDKVRHDCPVCQGSGICIPGNEKRWREWQITEFKKEFACARW